MANSPLTIHSSSAPPPCGAALVLCAAAATRIGFRQTAASHGHRLLVGLIFLLNGLMVDKFDNDKLTITINDYGKFSEIALNTG